MMHLRYAIALALLTVIACTDPAGNDDCGGMVFLEVQDPVKRAYLLGILDREQVNHRTRPDGICYHASSAVDISRYLIEAHNATTLGGRVLIQELEMVSTIKRELSERGIPYKVSQSSDGITIEVGLEHADQLREIAIAAASQFAETR